MLATPSIKSSEIMENYKVAYESFQEAKRVTKEVPRLLDIEDVDIAGKHFPMVSWCIKTPIEVLDKQFQEIIVSPERVNLAGKKRIIDSIDFFNSATIRIQRYWDTLLSTLKNNGKEVPPEFYTLQNNLKNALENMENAINRIPKEYLMLVRPEDVSDELGDYHRSISDIDTATKNFKSLTELIKEKEEILGNDETDKELKESSLSQLWDKIKEIKKVIEEKIDQISNRMTGLVAGFCTVLKESLTQFQNYLEAGKERILKILRDISDHLHDIISKLIERMFKFLTHIRSMAKTEGYAISKVEIKIPSITCEFVNIFFVTIPIPKIDPPEMTMTMESK